MENFPENALKILRARYFKKDENGTLLESKPSELFRRVCPLYRPGRKKRGRKKSSGRKISSRP